MEMEQGRYGRSAVGTSLGVGVASAASFLESLGCGFGFRETGDELWCLLERVRLLVKVWRVLGRTGEGRERSGETR